MDEPQYIPPKSSTHPLTIGGICLILWTLIVVLRAAFQTAQNAAHSTPCLTNLKTLGAGIKMYVVDHDSTMPLASNWYDIAAKNSDSESLHCPSVKDGIGYTLDSRVAGKKFWELPGSFHHIFFFESSDLARNASDPGTSFTVRHGSYGSPIVFFDGHARLFSEEAGLRIIRSGQRVDTGFCGNE